MAVARNDSRHSRCSPSLRPETTRIRTPASGKAGISQHRDPRARLMYPLTLQPCHEGAHVPTNAFSIHEHAHVPTNPSGPHRSSAVARGWWRSAWPPRWPRPTTTSAAATTSTKNTDTCAPRCHSKRSRPKVMKVRLTAVEHQLHAHEHDQRIAPQQQSRAADEKQRGPQRQVPAGRHFEAAHRRSSAGGAAGSAELSAA